MKKIPPNKADNFLKGFGYSVECHINDNAKEIVLKCTSNNTNPNLEISLIYNYLDDSGKGRSDYDVYHLEKYRIKFERSGNSIYKFSNGIFKVIKFKWSFTPGKNFLDELLQITNDEEITNWLWLFSEQLLESNSEYLKSSEIKSILKSKSLLGIEKRMISHPFLIKRKWNYIGFVNRDILDYNLSIELNKKNLNSRSLKKYISNSMLRYLDFEITPDYFEAAAVLWELKQSMVKAQRYEVAFRLKTVGYDFVVDIFRNYWPNMENADIAKCLSEYQLQLDLK